MVPGDMQNFCIFYQIILSFMKSSKRKLLEFSYQIGARVGDWDVWVLTNWIM